MGGAKGTPGDEDLFIGRENVMINIGGFYSNNPEVDHKGLPTKNEDKEVPPTDVATQTSPSTAMEIENEQSLEVSNASDVHK